MSRKLSPSRTGSADFGPLMPMLVPSPPLSLMTTVRPRARATAASSGRTSSRCGTSVSGSMVSSGMVPVAFDRSWSWKLAEHRHRELGNPRRAHLVRRSAQAVGGHAATLRCGHGPRSREVRTPHRAAGPTARARRRSRRRRRRRPAGRPRRSGLLDELGLRAGAVVTSYVAVPGEPPTAALNAALAAHGIRVLVPITLPDFDLDWHDAGDATAAPLGPDAVALADVVLAPGLAVDHHGTRMGQGGGCYDRALPRRRARHAGGRRAAPRRAGRPAGPPLPRRAARPAGRRGA